VNVEEGLKVAAVILDADGGCRFCVGDLASKLSVEFPNLDWPDLVRVASESKRHHAYTPERYADTVREYINALAQVDEP